MSSLGYAIVFLFCSTDSSHCELTGARAVRFADQAACQAGLADVVGASRANGMATASIARCRSLDEICRANLASVPMLPRSGLSAWTSVAVTVRGSALAGVLEILCHPDPGSGCAGE